MELEADNAGITEILEQSKSWCMRSQTTGVPEHLITASSITQNSSGLCYAKNDDLNWSSVTKSVMAFVYIRLVEYVYVMVTLLKGT